MRNKAVKKAILPILGLSLVLGSSLVLAAKPNKAKQVEGYSTSSLPTTIDLNDTTPADIRSYYSSLNSLTENERKGTNLLKNLKPILKTNQKYYSYDSTDESKKLWQIYEISDRDWTLSPASSTTSGTYNSQTNKITNYTYGTSYSSPGNNPYLHSLYVNRNVTNQMRAWKRDGGTENNHGDNKEWYIDREHIWPKSQGFNDSGKGGARGDPMHLWSGDSDVNSSIHNNNFYGYVDKTKTYSVGKWSYATNNYSGTSLTLKSGDDVFEPQDCDKGDIARAIFYMVARYNYLSGSDSDGIDSNNPNLELVQDNDILSSYTSSTAVKGKMGVLTDLLAWHHADPVDSFEIHRNNLLYTNYTNNRNPFIDFPEWVDYIWGTATYDGSEYKSYSSAPTGYAKPSTDTINGYNSGGSSDPVAVTGVSLNKNSTSIQAGSSETLTATVVPNNATNQNVTWTSSDESVATVSNSGLVSGIAEGSATITVRTSDGGYTASCTVTVTASSGGGGSSEGTDDGSVTAASGAFSGWTSDGLGSAYKDGSAKFDSSGDNVYKTDIFSGDVSTGMTSLSVTINAKVNGDPTSANSYKVEALDSSGNVLASEVKTGADVFSSSEYGDVTFSMDSGLAGCTGIKVTYVTKGGGNWGIMSIAWSASYSSGGEETKTLESISLDTGDAPTTFSVGDEFSYEGLSVTAYYDDGSDDIVTPTSVSTPNMSTAGQKTVTVTYSEGGVDKTATYTITVNAVTLTSIEVSGVKTEYYVGDAFVKPTVTAHFSNGSTSDVTNSATFTGHNLSNAGNQTVTVSYTNGTTETTSYSITVNAVTLTSIEISGYTTSFKVGDTFSFGGTVTANYNNGSTSDVTASATFTGYDMSSAGNQTVSVAYGGQSTTYQITVSESSGATDSTQYSLINSTSDLEVGKSYIITNGTSGTVKAIAISSNANNRKTTSATVSNSNLITRGSSIMSFTLGGTTDAYTFATENYAGTDGYLASASSGSYNYLRVISEAGIATISFNGDEAVINIGPHTERKKIRYNTSDLFACYSSGQDPVYLWKEVSSSVPLTSISASVSKSYYVGDTILRSDITVTGNNGQSISGFTFANNNYQFTYSDAVSGGSATSKTFTNSISYLEMTCSLTVSISRKEYETPDSESITLTSSEVFSGIGGGNSNLKSGTVTNDGVTYEYYKAYYYGGGYALSFGNASSQTGYLKNQTAFDSGITNVTVTSTGRTVNIRYSTDGDDWVLKSAADVENNIYKYFKLDCVGVAGSNYSNITSISITVNGEETATNVANYIMYEDTQNQCTSKFTVAKTRFEQMSTSERATFMTSDDYVIQTARTRLQAWANYLGKTITYSNDDYVISNNNYLSLMLRTKNNNVIAIIAIVSIVGVGSIAAYFFIKRRKPE